jgi:hypothetical protein
VKFKDLSILLLKQSTELLIDCEIQGFINCDVTRNNWAILVDCKFKDLQVLVLKINQLIVKFKDLSIVVSTRTSNNWLLVKFRDSQVCGKET